MAIIVTRDKVSIAYVTKDPMVYRHDLMLCEVVWYNICEQSARKRLIFWFADETMLSQVRF